LTKDIDNFVLLGYILIKNRGVKAMAYEQYRQALYSLINSINQVIPLSKENQVLIVWRLDSEEKIVKFNEWIKSKLKGENDLDATEQEIVRAAVKIGKGE